MNKQEVILKEKLPSSEKAIIISENTFLAIKIKEVLLFEELPFQTIGYLFAIFADTPLDDCEERKRYIEIVTHDNIEQLHNFALAVFYGDMVVYFPSVCRDKDGDLEINKEMIKCDDYQGGYDIIILKKDSFLSHYSKLN